MIISTLSSAGLIEGSLFCLPPSLVFKNAEIVALHFLLTCSAYSLPKQSDKSHFKNLSCEDLHESCIPIRTRPCALFRSFTGISIKKSTVVENPRTWRHTHALNPTPAIFIDVRLTSLNYIQLLDIQVPRGASKQCTLQRVLVKTRMASCSISATMRSKITRRLTAASIVGVLCTGHRNNEAQQGAQSKVPRIPTQ